MTPNFEQFNMLIQNGRRNHNLSIEELAVKVDISAAKMQDIENLCCYPNRATVECIASVLDIPFTKLWKALGNC